MFLGKNGEIINKFHGKEGEALYKIVEEILVRFNCTCSLVKDPYPHYYYLIRSPKLYLVVNVSSSANKYFIKIEHIEVDKIYRKQGICTEILDIMKKVALEYDVTIGLWCKQGKQKLFKFYSKRGFENVQTINDHWFEFNS